MNTEHNVERVLQRWLVDGIDEMPDRVYLSILDRVERQPQQRAWRVFWKDDMNPIIKLGAAAAAVILIAVIGYNLLPASQPQVGGPQPSAAPSVSPASPSVSSSPALAYTWPHPLDPGTYTTRLIWDIPFQLQFTVPEGWASRDVEVTRPDMSVGFNLAGNTYADPCRNVAAAPPTGTTVDDLARAIAALPVFDATDPRPVALDGAAGTYLELVVRSDAACAAPGLWADPPDAYNGAGPQGPPSWPAAHPNVKLWILDVDGTRFVITAQWANSATADDLAELQDIVDSIRFVPFSPASRSPSS